MMKCRTLHPSLNSNSLEAKALRVPLAAEADSSRSKLDPFTMWYITAKQQKE